MNIYDLPIVTDENAKDKTKALIHEDKIVCHPDLVEKVIEGMRIMRASAAGYERDVIQMTLPKAPELKEEKIKHGSER